MRHRLAVLMLIALLPMMDLLAAPAPKPPYAILDIGPPPKGETAEKYRKWYIERLANICGYYTGSDPEIKKLSSVPHSKVPGLLREENLRVEPEEGGCRLRLTLRTGTRSDQVAILNALLRRDLRFTAETIKTREEGLRIMEALGLQAAQYLKGERNTNILKRYYQSLEASKVKEAEVRAEIAQLEQVAVIRWAK